MNHPINRRTFLRVSLSMVAGSILGACNLNASFTDEYKDATAANPSDKMQNGPTEETFFSNKYVILASGLNFPEGPAFDHNGTLWFTEMGSGNLVFLKDDEIERIPVDGRPNGLAFDHQDRAWVCDSEQNKIRRYTHKTQSWETMLEQIEGNPLQTPNDLIFDPLGNLLVSCPNFNDDQPKGYVVCLSPDGSSQIIIRDMHRPNGLELINQGQHLVVADTYKKILYKCRWDPTKVLCSGFQEWAIVGGSEGPDGMAVTSKNLLLSSIFGNGEILILDQDGQIVMSILLPGKNPTNVAIDPMDRYGLVITEAEKGLLLSFPHYTYSPEIYDGGQAWP